MSEDWFDRMGRSLLKLTPFAAVWIYMWREPVWKKLYGIVVAVFARQGRDTVFLLCGHPPGKAVVVVEEVLYGTRYCEVVQ